MVDSSYGNTPQSFGETYKSLWVDKGQTRFNRTLFENFTSVINKSVAPLKPLLGPFLFTAYDDQPVWSDNSERFFDAWNNLVVKSYPDNMKEIALLFTGFALSSRLGLKNESWGIFLTDTALYASVSLYGGERTRRYPYPAPSDISPGWATIFARRIVDDFDPEGIEAFAKLTGEMHSFDDSDNPEKLVMGNTSDPKRMGDLMVTCLVLALDAYVGAREAFAKQGAEQQDEKTKSTPTPLTVRAVELGLDEYIKLGSDPRKAKHFKKIASKFEMDEDENIIFSFTDATFAGVYGLAITDRAIRSRDLMEEPVMQPLGYGTVFREGYTLVIGGGPVHTVGELIPERLMPSVATLLDEYLAGKISLT